LDSTQQLRVLTVHCTAHGRATRAPRPLADGWRAYFKQAREELGLRLLEKCYTHDTGVHNKYWMAFANRKFLNKQL
jgi:hypothetical protein